MKSIVKKNEFEYPRMDYYCKVMIDVREIFIQYGKWLSENGIEGQGTIEDYEQFLIEKDLEDKIDLINTFKDRLLYGGYKVILYNGQVPILEDNTGIIDYIIECLEESTEVELNGDELIIHTKKELIELTGHEEMSDLEIFARNYLNDCGDDLILRDNESQIELREENIRDINKEGFYDKCKDIINIEDFLRYDEESTIYKMNWSAIWITYNNGNKELWDRP